LRSKLAELDHTVSLARSGEFDLAATIVQTNLGKRDMDAMRQHLGTIATHQSARRVEAFDRARTVGGNLLPLILGLWLLIVLFGWASVVGERRRAATHARAEQADELREAHERVQLLVEELNHRVKNLFAVVLSIVKLSGRKQAPAAEVVGDIGARIHALMQAHDAALANGGTEVALREVVERTLAPYQSAGGASVSFAGPEVTLAARNITPMALILHELATNAAKYGALSQVGGVLALNWTCAPDPEGGQIVTLQWREQGGPPVGEEARQPGSGFGTRMTGMAASQLGGEITRDWPDEGALVTLTFPQV
jgi:two-component sensor histidine kinase